MTVAALPPPLTTSNPNVIPPVDPSDARKRRRAILTLQRTVSGGDHPIVTTSADVVVKKRRKQVVSDDDSGEEGPSCVRGNKKKPQLKYDPEVPMTKEEATAWRREQRRQRNRLSAAMSRQRQRNHITELEGELDGWKSKYQAVMDKIQAIEKANPELAKKLPEPRSMSPEPVPSGPAVVTSPTSSAMFPHVVALEENLKLPGDFLDQGTAAAAQPPKMISRPAMSRFTHRARHFMSCLYQVPHHQPHSFLTLITA